MSVSKLLDEFTTADLIMALHRVDDSILTVEEMRQKIGAFGPNKIHIEQEPHTQI